MRQTGKEILDPNVSNEGRHAWLSTATADELSDFLRWVKADSPWALHGRDALNVVLARESIKLQTRIKNLMAVLASFEFYGRFIEINNSVVSSDNIVANSTNSKSFVANTANTDQHPNQTNQPKDGNNERFGRTKTTDHK